MAVIFMNGLLSLRASRGCTVAYTFAPLFRGANKCRHNGGCGKRYICIPNLRFGGGAGKKEGALRYRRIAAD
jgi:hypothetical protein